MTKEQLDKIASDYLNDCESESDMLEVFEVAKEALKYEDIRDCNTCTYNENGNATGTCQLCMHDNQYKQEPKTGHWINAKVGKLFPSNDFKCSECGNILDFNGVNCGRGDANYCPNCGARMESEETE